MNVYNTGYARLHAAGEQAAYRRRVAVFGIPALLAPYTVKQVRHVPRHRRST